MSPHQQNLLRQQLIHGLSLDELAGLYRVHRATVARWVAEAKANLSIGTKALLAERFNLTKSEQRGLSSYLKSHIEVSVRTLLKSQS